MDQNEKEEKQTNQQDSVENEDKETATSEKKSDSLRVVNEDEPSLSWETVLKETEPMDISPLDDTRCWNCNVKLQGEDWCDNCKVPVNKKTRAEITKRSEPLTSEKCWRCKGTTSGDICGVCGSPLTQKGIEIISDAIKPEAKYEREEEKAIFILSPRDRQLVKVSARFSEIEGIVAKHFTIASSVLTNYGPEIIIFKPENESNYNDFEKEELLVNNNIKTLFRKVKSTTEGANAVAMRFFYWTPSDFTKPFQFKKIKWKLLFLALSIITIVITGWLYVKDIMDMLAVQRNIFLDVLIFSSVVIGIMIIHELGHFLMQKKKKINLSLPYFVPIPPTPGFLSFFLLGTAGGFVRVLDPINRRNDLFDLYFIGPLSGIIVAIPLVLVGLAFPIIANKSTFTSAQLETIANYQISNPITLLGVFLEWIASTTGISPAFDPNTQVLFMHPLTIGATIGLVLNGINFLPGSILDGGFMIRSLFGDALTRIFSFVVSIILMLNFNTWALGVLVMFMPLSVYQSPVTNEAIKVHWSKYILEIIAIFLAICCIPKPPFFLVRISYI
ncbi:MAG: site-2 protease family protein [Candidatus Heimdallarchaeota archaeon]